MKKKYIIYSLLIFLVLGCSQNKYEIAKGLYNKKKFALAIDFYDKYIAQEQRGANVTIAEIERSEAYLELGKKAYEQEEWELANRLFYLANSQTADTFMDNCYYELAQQAITKNDKETALAHFGYILKNLQTSELIPQILFERLNIYLEQDKKFFAYDDYAKLASEFPRNEYTNQAQPIIDAQMHFYLQDAEEYKEAEHFNIALEKFFYLEKNPSKYHNRIKTEIADVYIHIAEQEILSSNYIQAKKYFERAIEWDLSQQNWVDKRLNEVVNLFIDKGNELVEANQIEKAIDYYQEIFDIIPNHPEAKKQIAIAKKIQADHIAAERLAKEGAALEQQGKFALALKKYQQSYQLHAVYDIFELIERLKNIVEAEKDPITFAKAIILNYKDGTVARKIYMIESDLESEYGKDIKSSGWKVLYSFGKYKYEIRYDILSPEENYYFLWRVDLENRNVSPLNKLTENILSIEKVD